MPKTNHAGKVDRLTIRLTKRTRKRLRRATRRAEESESDFARQAIIERIERLESYQYGA